MNCAESLPTLMLQRRNVRKLYAGKLMNEPIQKFRTGRVANFVIENSRMFQKNLEEVKTGNDG
jgi:hypothetical protein